MRSKIPGPGIVILAMLPMLAIHLTAQSPRPQLAILYNFTGLSDGSYPEPVVIGSGGVLYGATITGGASNCGTVFSLTPPRTPAGAWTETVLYSFTCGSDGSSPSGVVIGSGGALYGTTNSGGGAGFGTVFSVEPPASPEGTWRYTMLHSFAGTPDGATPDFGVAVGACGMLYGTTLFGGANNAGTIFSMTPPSPATGSWKEETLFSFGGPDSSNPSGGVAIGGGGVLYGTISFGGTSGYGAVYSLTPPLAPRGKWLQNSLYNSTGGANGANPNSGVAVARGGVLFGTTIIGGIGSCISDAGCGTVFALKPLASTVSAWQQFVLYSFTGFSDGGNPTTSLVIGNDDKIYGTDGPGFTFGAGTLFSLTPPSSPGGAWTENVLHDFTGGADGGYPNCVTPPVNGVLYCSATQGGEYGAGTVFALRP